MRIQRAVTAGLMAVGLSLPLSVGLSQGVASAATAVSCVPGVYSPSQCGLALSAVVLAPGALVTVSGSGFASLSTVVITFPSTSATLATVTTNASGSFVTTVQIPSNASAGTHRILATGTNANGTSRQLVAIVTVQSVVAVPTAVPVVTPPSHLAFTGIDAEVVGAVGVGAIGLGGLVMAGSRRRRSSKA